MIESPSSHALIGGITPRGSESLKTSQMDVEAAHRKQLIEALGSSFLCFEEVEIEHPVLTGLSVKADVIAIPVEGEYWGHALAFEVKCYDEAADCGKWSTAIKQASDYVLGRIRSDNHVLAGRRVSAALVYPGPKYIPYIPRQDAPVDIAARLMIAGAFLCAMNWRVGRAHRDEREGLCLSFGPLAIWTQRLGFTAQARNLLRNKRPVGSRSVDVAAILDGFDAVMPEFE